MLAEDEAEAKADEIARWEPADRCLVYNDEGRDITLARARQDFLAA